MITVQPDLIISTREESLGDELDNDESNHFKYDEPFIDDKETEKSNSSDSDSVNFSDKDFDLSDSDTDEFKEKPKKKTPEIKAFACKECDKSYAKSSYLSQHVKHCHSNMESITCEVEGCGKVFKLSSSYQVHMKAKHSEKKPKPEEDSSSKYFCCEKCPLRFRLKDRFESHLKFHEGIKPVSINKLDFNSHF